MTATNIPENIQEKKQAIQKNYLNVLPDLIRNMIPRSLTEVGIKNYCKWTSDEIGNNEFQLVFEDVKSKKSYVQSVRLASIFSDGTTEELKLLTVKEKIKDAIGMILYNRYITNG